MDMHELHQMRELKDHEMRHGHLSEEDRDAINMHKYGEYLNKHDKHYHSPEK